jgi:hypothetical protein
MRKEWYIKLKDRTEGPLTKLDLKMDPRVTPDTLAWRSGMPDWLPIEDIPELKDIFEEAAPPPEHFEAKQTESDESLGPERIMEMSPDPNYFFYVILVVVLIILIFVYSQYF